jgi:hypothetical protein
VTSRTEAILFMGAFLSARSARAGAWLNAAAGRPGAVR